jgi:putative acetyltransferase
VAPQNARKGVGSLLLQHLLSLEPVQPLYTTEASELSKGLFEKFGFKVIEIEHTELNDVAFTRYGMRMHT